MAFIAELLSSAGIQTSIHEKEPGRANLVARIPGGDAPALMLTGHIDVVTTADQSWTHPPFAAETIDGVIWGRGTLDMKGGVAMMLAAAVRVVASGFRPAGDLVLAFVADEEAGGRLGASYLVDEHPELFSGVHYAIGEFGGFPLRIGKTRFTMIQVAEKQICLIEATIRGPAGHGARPMRGGAMATLARVLDRLDRVRLPIHVTPVAERMVESIACRLPILERVALRRLLDPRFTDRILGLLGESGRLFEPLFRHTANATIVRGGEKTNVIPGRIRWYSTGGFFRASGPMTCCASYGALSVMMSIWKCDSTTRSPGQVTLGCSTSLGTASRPTNPVRFRSRTCCPVAPTHGTSRGLAFSRTASRR